MAFLGKEYKYVKEEKFVDFLRAVGIPEDQVQKSLQYKPSYKIEKDGDSYTLTTTLGSEVQTTTFKSGVAFDDKNGENTYKSTYTVNGDTITQGIASEKGEGTFLREYNGDELVVTLSSPKVDVVAKRWYKA